MANNNIKIDFPKSIEVESNDIKTIRVTAERISNWLHNDLRNIIAPLQVLHKVPDMLSEFQKNMIEQFSSLFQNQIETLVIARQANIKILTKKISLVKEHVSKKESQLKEAKQHIIDRYKNLRDKLIRQHVKFLKAMDSHAFDIVEKIYPKEIEEKFSFISVPAQNYIVAHTEESALVRYSLIKEKIEETKRIIWSFLDKREDFYDAIDRYAVDLEEGVYQLPYYYVEIEEIDTKKKRTEIYFPFALNSNNNEEKINVQDLLVLKDAALKRGEEGTEKIEGMDILINYLKNNSEIPLNELNRFVNDIKKNNLLEK